MEDRTIIAKFENREEDVLAECTSKYGAYLRKIAMNILRNREDAEEVLNDTWLQAWNAIPPERPANLLAFLTVIARANAIDLYRKKHSEKRKHFFEAQPLSELADIIPDTGGSTEESADRLLLQETINRFLKDEQNDARVVFVMRYFYMDSILEISEATGFSLGKVKTLLFRTRKKLKQRLTEEGYSL